MNLRFDSRQHLLTLNSFSSNEAAERLSEYLRHCPDALRPTAILASGDYIAAGASLRWSRPVCGCRRIFR